MTERELRIRAANLVNEILYRLGGLSAIVPRGEVMDAVDASTDEVVKLAGLIGEWKPSDGS